MEKSKTAKTIEEYRKNRAKIEKERQRVANFKKTKMTQIFQLQEKEQKRLIILMTLNLRLKNNQTINLNIF